MKRTCLTELHTMDSTGKVTGVTLCRSEMRINATNPALPFWVCTNERCETVQRVAPEDVG